MKKFTILLFVIASCMYASAQRLKIEKSRSQLYITHQVEAKETLYSLGRVYNTSPKEIAAINKLKPDAGLSLGQQLKIPLSKSNLVQANPSTKRGLQALYHSVNKGENLSKISASYNRVRPELIKKWNKMPGSAVKPGQELIVGYLKKNPNTEIAKQKPNTNKAVAKKQEPVMDKAEGTPLPNHQYYTASFANEPKDQFIPLLNNHTNSFFEPEFAVNAASKIQKTITGTGSMFKTTSGWSDGKYYILIDGVAPETVVKVTVNGRSIYAKALEALPELKHNKSLLCRLSSAAVAALNIPATKFLVEVSYYE